MSTVSGGLLLGCSKKGRVAWFESTDSDGQSFLA
jgi:hypothetical protein